MRRPFSIDQDRVARFIAAGDAATTLARELLQAEQDAREALSRIKGRRDEEERDQPRSSGFVYLGEDKKEVDLGRFDAEIARIEVICARAIKARSDASARIAHDQRLANHVRDFTGDRSHTRALFVNGERV